ncbi:MAG: hypothetical protein EXQ81_10475 [Thermoleophilia bacterium]|nr:hypothetical protein [Thermoleophilia bacterium]
MPSLGAASWRARASLGAAFAALVAAISTIPYLFPTSRDLPGASAQLGFNNTAAYLVYLIVLPLPAALLARALGAPAAVRPSERAIETPQVRLPWRLFTLVAALHALFFLGLYLYRGRFVFSDGVYFQDILHRMSQGEVPYRDFFYAYGPAMIYPASWLSGLLGLPAAYALWYVATYVGGLLALLALLCRLVPAEHRPGRWWLLLTIAFFFPGTGLNATDTRYLLPSLAFFAFLDWRRGGARAAVLSAVAVAAGSLYSYEIALLTFAGIALLVGLTALPVLPRLAERLCAAVAGGLGTAHDTPGDSRAWSILPVGAGLLLAVALLYAVDPGGSALRDYPGAAAQYSTGSHGVPIAPNLLVCALLAISVFATGGTIRLLADGAASASLLAYLGLALLAQRGSLVSTDPVHVVSYGLPTVLLALHLSTRLPRGGRARRAGLALVLVGFALPFQSVTLAQVTPFLGGAGVTGSAPRPAASATTDAPTTSAAVQAALSRIVASTGTDRPYLMYDLGYYSGPVYERFGLRHATYEPTFPNTQSPEAVRRAIEEVRGSRAYVVMRASDLDGAAASPRPDPLWDAYAAITGAPMPASSGAIVQAEARARMLEPFLVFLRSEYRRIDTVDGFVVLVRR